ncbi:MAG: cupin-like domain-containing protein [Thermoleophilaceae bacterium]
MIDLATLVSPLSVEDFFEQHWPDKPYSSSSDEKRLERLREITELDSAEAALSKARAIKVFRPDGEMAIVPDGRAALPLYKLGLTCYLGSKHIPALRQSREQLAADLGLPAGSVDCEVFCSSGDSGAWMHSDYDVNFALLLSGTKRWRLAPNEHIRNQTTMCVPSTRKAPDQLQLELADVQPFPERMPDDALEIDVEAGGLVFMPRGWWHETEASGDCLQVNFVVQGPMWQAVLTRALKDRLVRDPDWRAYAFDLYGPPERRDAALDEFARLLAGLRGQLEDLISAEDHRALAERLVEDSGYLPAKAAVEAK